MVREVVSRILELDARAEEIIERAREEATDIRYQIARKLDEYRAECDRRKAEEAARIESEAAAARQVEVERERAAFASQADGARNQAGAAVEKAVGRIVSAVKGAGG